MDACPFLVFSRQPPNRVIRRTMEGLKVWALFAVVPFLQIVFARYGSVIGGCGRRTASNDFAGTGAEDIALPLRDAHHFLR